VRTAKAKAPFIGDEYDRDYHGWAIHQAEALRARRLDQLDVENLAEEVEDLARRVKKELQHRAEVLLAHLLKWQYQPEKKSSSWQATIDEQRQRIADLLAENPSLKPQFRSVLRQAYGYAVRQAGLEMGLSKVQWQRRLPSACPWDAEAEILNLDFLPESNR
jgi:hypothetical protein